MEYALQTRGLCRQSNRSSKGDGISINVPRGSIYVLLGAEGSGKSTLLRIITGLQSQDEGLFQIGGKISKREDLSAPRRDIGSALEEPAVYTYMTAEQNMRQQQMLWGRYNPQVIREVVDLTGLDLVRKKKVATFSTAMMGRLVIAMALCTEPSVVILDEPGAGLSPEERVEIRKLIKEINREKKITFIITSSTVDEIAMEGSYFGIINKSGSIKEVSARKVYHICKTLAMKKRKISPQSYFKALMGGESGE